MEIVRRIVAIPFGLLALSILALASFMSLLALLVASVAKWIAE
jgi:hypothetical protein